MAVVGPIPATLQASSALAAYWFYAFPAVSFLFLTITASTVLFTPALTLKCL
jgi:hypothetical protein